MDLFYYVNKREIRKNLLVQVIEASSFVYPFDVQAEIEACTKRAPVPPLMVKVVEVQATQVNVEVATLLLEQVTPLRPPATVAVDAA